MGLIPWSSAHHTIVITTTLQVLWEMLRLTVINRKVELVSNTREDSASAEGPPPCTEELLMVIVGCGVPIDVERGQPMGGQCGHAIPIMWFEECIPHIMGNLDSVTVHHLVDPGWPLQGGSVGESALVRTEGHDPGLTDPGWPL